MILCTPDDLRRIEKLSRIPEATLVETAGESAARSIMQEFPLQLEKGVAVFCGPGNNGADGLVVARYLTDHGVQNVKVFYTMEDLEALRNLKNFSLVVDALYGIGLNRPLRGGLIEHAIDVINSSGLPVVAIDTPSGLDCRTGVAGGAVVRATLTLTFTALKLGFFTAQAKVLCGRIRILPVGIPKSIVRDVSTTYRLFGKKEAREFLPQRSLSSNKTTFGHVAVCAGQPGFWGAGLLATEAAFRTGSGYVSWASTEAPVSELKLRPEALTATLDDLLKSEKKISAFVVGPGLGVNKSTSKFLRALKKRGEPAVIDADAISVLAKEGADKLPPQWILTPHTGEYHRLTGVTVAETESNRFQAAMDAARNLGCVVLLKGFRTVVATGDRCSVINSGNPALAKAGTGDVLSGIIGSFLGQGLPPFRAACMGAYIHGLLADQWVRDGKDVASLVAMDLVEGLPETLSSIRKLS